MGEGEGKGEGGRGGGGEGGGGYLSGRYEISGLTDWDAGSRVEPSLGSAYPN